MAFHKAPILKNPGICGKYEMASDAKKKNEKAAWSMWSGQRIFIELITSDRERKASREGSK